MKFEDIFKKPGLYKADSFSEGVCFEVTKEGYLMLLEFSSVNDLFPNT